jgi:predicted ATPase
MNDIKLRKIRIEGYKSIESLDFDARNLNILIGPNGAGKSNFISFFKFLGKMLESDGRLQEYVTYLGGASDILFDGVDKTKKMYGYLEIENEKGINEYQFKLQFVKPDSLAFSEEKYRYSLHSIDTKAKWFNCGIGHLEAKLPLTDNSTAQTITLLLRKLTVYQFHNTSDTSPMRLKWNTTDGRYLKQNGDNLGSFLFYIQTNDSSYYNRIIRYIRTVIPFFDDFVLYDEFGKILIRWKEKGTNKEFNASQASDGMLRTIALIALLAQNPENLPPVVFLDEPELGLHPKAIDLLSGLLKQASEYAQVFVATQSIGLVNNFELEDLVVINRKGRASEIHRVNPEEFKNYIEDYSTGEIWDKNIIGGRP